MAKVSQARWTLRLPQELADDVDALAEVLGMGRSELVRQLLEEAIPTLGPVLAFVQEAREKALPTPEVLEGFKQLMLRRVRQLEIAVGEVATSNDV